jgi:porphobilinogen synthase
MPGVFRQSLDLTVQTVKENYDLGIKAVNLYMKVSTTSKIIPEKKPGTQTD